MHTKEIVTNAGYTVIYGDTDSVMINTGAITYQEYVFYKWINWIVLWRLVINSSGKLIVNIHS